MDSFFFIPGSRLRNLDKISALGITEAIIDLEDALRESDRASILAGLEDRGKYLQCYLRVPFHSSEESGISTHLLEQLLRLGYKKFVFPKIGSFDDFQRIMSTVETEGIKIILLIETPQLFLEARNVVTTYSSLISGIGLGSHDFMAATGGEHNLENLSYPRQHILYLARMVNAVPIDIASMELDNRNALAGEIMDGFRKGYDAKFFIHPWQLRVLKEMTFYSENEYEWATSIMKEFNKTRKKEEFEPVVINGQVIERPHIERAQKILKYYKHEG